MCRRAPATSSRSTSRRGKTIWRYDGNLNEEINTVCCGWTSRGVAIGDGRVYLGKLDGDLVALDAGSGKQVWSAAVGDWRKGETITSAPLYYDGPGRHGDLRRRVRRPEQSHRIRRRDRQARVAVLHDPRPRSRPGTTPGRRTTTRGSTEALLSGRHRQSIRNSGSSTSRPATRHPTSTAAAARATTCSRTRSSRSTPRRASIAGTSSRCTTTSGTSTLPRRSCSST